MIVKNDVDELTLDNLDNVSGGVILDRTDVYPYNCYNENTGELIGTKWNLEEAEELCRSQNCSTNLIPVEQAHQLQYHMRKQSSKIKRKKKK